MRRLAAPMLLLALCAAALAEVPEEFRIKREAVFDFASKPVVTRDGDRTTINFETRGLCDVTVAVEDPAGRIIRHLASGVLGKNAPPPFARDSKKQSIVWDGKDDQGRYVKDADACTVRVSLGLRPRFERTLFWSPKKRIAPGRPPVIVPRPEGVYVFEGAGVDHLRLFDHQGNYVRTLHPFPSDKLDKVTGLTWAEFPQDGQRLPLKGGLVQATLLTSGDNLDDNTMAKYGNAASAMAILGDRIALAKRSLGRLATDATTGGMQLTGPRTWREVQGRDRKPDEAYPRSAAFSPDGKWLYLSGYRGDDPYSWLHGVVRMEYLGDGEPQPFVGSMKPGDAGAEPGKFRDAMGVACDAKGRVFVADYHNDRIQVFDADGKHLKSIGGVNKPVRVFVHPKSGHIYVISWMLVDKFYTSHEEKVPATLTELGPLEDPRRIGQWELPLVGYNPTTSWNRSGGIPHDAYVDVFTDPVTVWLVPGAASTSEQLMLLRQADFGPWSNAHIRLMQVRDGKLETVDDFGADVAKKIVRATPPAPPSMDRQRLYVDPTTGLLYVAEGDSGVGKAFRKLLVIDPEKATYRELKLPFSTEEIAFDLDGLIYLRTDTQVSRFNPSTWREVPWDYGEEREKPGFDGDGPTLTAVIALPGSGRPGCFHLGGFAVSPRGDIAVSCYNVKALQINIPGAFHAQFAIGKPYTPPLYPGRLRWGEVHVWDRHGQPTFKDAVGGLPMTDGLAIDGDGNIYAMLAANRVLDGEEYFLERAETLIKFRPGKAKLLSASRKAPIALEPLPERPPDLARGFLGRAWVEGAEWMYGGVGFGGFNSSKGGGGCACWNARFALDLFARSFAPEVDHFSVAVLDSGGNLITRVGRYGNVDEGRPLDPAGGPADPRSIGGDEVALFNASYVGTFSDRRLFIADYGNYRILSVKLDYHSTEIVKLAGR